jgi:predicted secreted protein
MSLATFAKGTQLKAGDGGNPETFTLIPEIRSISGPGMSADTLDATSMDTPGGFRDKKQGLKDWGTLSFELLWIPTNARHQQLFDDFKAGTERNYELVFPNVGNTKFSFKGFVNRMPAQANFDALLTLSVEITIMGDPEPTLA